MSKPSDYAHLIEASLNGGYRTSPFDPSPSGGGWEPVEFYIPDEALAAQKPTRARKPSLEHQVRQLLKAGQAVGVQIAVTVEGDKVTATPTRGIGVASAEPPPTTSAEPVNPWDEDLGTVPLPLRQ
jgi:hypothetical protein